MIREAFLKSRIARSKSPAWRCFRPASRNPASFCSGFREHPNQKTEAKSKHTSDLRETDDSMIKLGISLLSTIAPVGRSRRAFQRCKAPLASALPNTEYESEFLAKLAAQG